MKHRLLEALMHRAEVRVARYLAAQRRREQRASFITRVKEFLAAFFK